MVLIITKKVAIDMADIPKPENAINIPQIITNPSALIKLSEIIIIAKEGTECVKGRGFITHIADKKIIIDIVFLDKMLVIIENLGFKKDSIFCKIGIALFAILIKVEFFNLISLSLFGKITFSYPNNIWSDNNISGIAIIIVIPGGRGIMPGMAKKIRVKRKLLPWNFSKIFFIWIVSFGSDKRNSAKIWDNKGEFVWFIYHYVYINLE